MFIIAYVGKNCDMDRLFSTNFEDTEVYNVLITETENVRDVPPNSDCKTAETTESYDRKN